MILVSRNIRYIRDIREGSLGRGAKRRRVVEMRNFHRLLLAICTETIDMIYRIYNAVYTGRPTALRRLFSGPKCMTLNEPE